MKKMDVWPCLDYLHSLELPKHHEDMLTLKLAVEKADNLAQHAKKAMGFLFWVGLGNNQVNFRSTLRGVLDGEKFVLVILGNSK